MYVENVCNTFLRVCNKVNKIYQTFFASCDGIQFVSDLQKSNGITYLEYKQAQSNSKVEENLLQDFRSVPNFGSEKKVCHKLGACISIDSNFSFLWYNACVT